MTKLLRDLLRHDYVAILKAKAMETHHNYTSISRLSAYSIPHISNVFRGEGSDDAIGAVCSVLGVEVRSLFKQHPDSVVEETAPGKTDWPNAQ